MLYYPTYKCDKGISMKNYMHLKSPYDLYHRKINEYEQGKEGK